GSIAGRTITRYTPAASTSRPAMPTNSVLLIDHLHPQRRGSQCARAVPPSRNFRQPRFPWVILGSASEEVTTEPGKSSRGARRPPLAASEPHLLRGHCVARARSSAG